MFTTSSGSMSPEELMLFRQEMMRAASVVKPIKLKDPENMSVEDLKDKLAYAQSQVEGLRAARDQWASRSAKYSKTIDLLQDDLFRAQKSMKQEDIRRVVNRALRAYGHKPMSIPRAASKEAFLASLSNHLNNIFAKEEIKDELPV